MAPLTLEERTRFHGQKALGRSIQVMKVQDKFAYSMKGGEETGEKEWKEEWAEHS